HAPTPTANPLSLHDALPISGRQPAPDHRDAQRWTPYRQGQWWRSLPVIARNPSPMPRRSGPRLRRRSQAGLSLIEILVSVVILGDRKSTRLNSSHVKISYAV